MKTPHHAILKAAEKRNIEIDATDAHVYVFTHGDLEVRNLSAKDGLAEMIKLIEADASDEDEGDADEANDEAAVADADFAEEAEGAEEDAPEGRSIVKRAYQVRYRPTQNTNGDQIAQDLRAYLEDTADDGSPCINRERLIRFAKANGFWDAKYTHLNNGQVRMNVGNKLRNRIKKDADFNPEWPS